MKIILIGTILSTITSSAFASDDWCAIWEQSCQTWNGTTWCVKVCTQTRPTNLHNNNNIYIESLEKKCLVQVSEFDDMMNLKKQNCLKFVDNEVQGNYE